MRSSPLSLTMARSCLVVSDRNAAPLGREGNVAGGLGVFGEDVHPGIDAGSGGAGRGDAWAGDRLAYEVVEDADAVVLSVWPWFTSTSGRCFDQPVLVPNCTV